MAKILVVEDSLYQRKSIIKNITSWGHEVEAAGNGIEGLEALKNFIPDLIITDLLMPEMDGFGFMEKLNDNGNIIPIVVLSADIQSSVIEQCKLLGAKDFLSKPLDKAKLKLCIGTLLG